MANYKILVELALGGPAGFAPDFGGPRVYAMVDLFRSYLRATGRRRVVVPVWLPGTSARAVRAGGNRVAPRVPSPPAGIKTWEEFLVERTTMAGATPLEATSPGSIATHS